MCKSVMETDVDELRFRSARDILDVLPFDQIRDNLLAVIKIAPDLMGRLLEDVKIPVMVRRCLLTGREFLCGEQNRDGNAYRSPWSNEYDPPLEKGIKPSGDLREMEIVANHVFETYRDLYYQGGLTSVYVAGRKSGFSMTIMIKTSRSRGGGKGELDAVHDVDVEVREDGVKYVMRSMMMVRVAGMDGADISGSLSNSGSREGGCVKRMVDHIAEIGKMVEDAENRIWRLIQDVYLSKTQYVCNTVRIDSEEKKKQATLIKKLYE